MIMDTVETSQLTLFLEPQHKKEILDSVISPKVPERTAHMPAVTDEETKQHLSVLVQVADPFQ